MALEDMKKGWETTMKSICRRIFEMETKVNLIKSAYERFQKAMKNPEQKAAGIVEGKNFKIGFFNKWSLSRALSVSKDILDKMEKKGEKLGYSHEKANKFREKVKLKFKVVDRILKEKDKEITAVSKLGKTIYDWGEFRPIPNPRKND